MRATYLYGAGDVRVIDVPEPGVEEPGDAVVRIVRACVCGSDLHPYHSAKPSKNGRGMGHEALGVVEDVGADVTAVAKGDLVIVPFVTSDGTCEFCREGLQTSCIHGNMRGGRAFTGLQAEVARVPLADGTLFRLDGAVQNSALEDSDLLASLLTLSDVYGTGWHAATRAGVGPGDTVAVIGDGAVGLLAVLSAAHKGAERIILMGRHTARTDLGREFGATDVVAERGDEGIAAVKDIAPQGVAKVLEAVGHMPAYEQALGIVRPGGVISRVGVPQYEETPVGFGSLFGSNVSLTGGPAPTRAYMAELLPGVLDGTVQPGRVFDRAYSIDEVPDAYRAMDDREVLKALIEF